MAPLAPLPQNQLFGRRWRSSVKLDETTATAFTTAGEAGAAAATPFSSAAEPFGRSTFRATEHTAQLPESPRERFLGRDMTGILSLAVCDEAPAQLKHGFEKPEMAQASYPTKRKGDFEMHHSQRIKFEDKLPESGTGLAASQIRQPYQACALASKQDWSGKGPYVVKEDFASSVFKQEEGCDRDTHHQAAHEQMTDKEVDEVEELSRVWLQSDTSEEEEAILRADFHAEDRPTVNAETDWAERVAKAKADVVRFVGETFDRLGA